MPALDFPANPVVGQLFTTEDRTWSWSGTTWDSVAGAGGGGGSATDIGVFYGCCGKTTPDVYFQHIRQSRRGYRPPRKGASKAQRTGRIYRVIY